MGNRRIGRARLEKVLESLGRTLDMGGKTILKGVRRPVVTLVDQAGATAIRTAILASESGTIFTVPALSSGTQTITLPALSTDTIGCTYTFVAIATVAQDFNVLGAGSDKILGVTPDGAGNNTAISQGYDSVGFDENAVLGGMFTVSCITSTAATGWQCYQVIDGLAANTATINYA